MAGVCSIGTMFAQVKKPAAAGKTTAAKPAATAAVTTYKNNKDSASYALGVRIAQNLKGQGFDGVNMNVLQKAMADVLQGKKLMLDDAVLDKCIGEYQQKASGEKAAVAKKAGQAFLAVNGKRSGVVTLPSGMQYEVVKAGTDTSKPTLNDRVTCHYHGTLIDGTVFDSSVERGEPITFQLGGVIRGWQEALQLMTVGSKWKLYIPSDLAYGDRAAGAVIAPGSTLVFEVELISIEKGD